jgi:integrase
MKGGIYTSERCPLCGGPLLDDRRRSVRCPTHEEQTARSLRVKYGKIYRRFNNYPEAERFLIGLRFEEDQGRLDPRDYQTSKPLAFETLSGQWLAIKKEEMAYRSWRNLMNAIDLAKKTFAGHSVNRIDQTLVTAWTLSIRHLSSKTRHGYSSTLRQFFAWAEETYTVKVPSIPLPRFEMAFRKTVDKETQDRILEEVKRICAGKDPKVYLGTLFLTRYLNLRPGELRNIKEGDIDLVQGEIIITKPKTRWPKRIFLLPEDVETLKTMPRGLPHLYFFRHKGGRSGIKAGARFGRHLFRDYWRIACRNLGIEGLDLYGGTRHTSVKALRGDFTPEELKLLTGHASQAFNRYFQEDADLIRMMQGRAAGRSPKASGTNPAPYQKTNLKK